MQSRHALSGVVTAAVTILVALLAVAGAQQPPPPQPPSAQTPPPMPAQPAGPPAKAFVPLAASTLAANPDAYYEVVRFDPAEIAKKLKGYTLDLAPDVAARFTGHPVVLATSVITVAGVDVAKRPPPPMTAEELALQKIMKQVAPASAALRGAVDQMNMPLVKENTTVLKQAFTQTEAFWKAKGKTDATQWAADARKDTAGRVFSAAVSAALAPVP